MGDDDPMYNQFISADHGMISGCPNIVLLAAALVLLVGVIVLVAVLTKKQKKKNKVSSIKAGPKGPKPPVVVPEKKQDVMEDIETEIKNYNDQKRKLSMYLSYLQTRDGEGIQKANARRFMAGVNASKLDKQFGIGEEDDEDDEEKNEFYERKRRSMVNQLGGVLKTKPRRSAMDY